MPLDPDTIANQQTLLREHRRRLAHLLQQLGTFGAHTSHHIMADIEEAQAEIRAIKAALRNAGATADDEPNDDLLARQVFQRERQARLRAAGRPRRLHTRTPWPASSAAPASWTRFVPGQWAEATDVGYAITDDWQ
jgi:hypothetical protein